MIAAGAMSDPPPPRILVVDDQTSILFAMSEYLAAHGYVVDCALDDVEAMTLLGRHAYRVVIVDLRLTPARDDDGLDVLSFVHDHCPQTRTILLTAYGSPAVETDARRRGADVVLYKPQPLQGIARIVDELLSATPR
jgi:CheY-like chemotaxis protein